MFRRARKLLFRPLVNRRLSRADFRVEDGINVFGETRGGTTWLFEMLRELPGAVPQFEPFHVNHGVIPEELGWPVRPRLEAAYATPPDRKLVDDILRYRARNAYTVAYVRPTDLWRPKRVLTKCIMGTGVLPYLLATYDFAHPPILLLRHPLASSLSYFRRWGHAPFNREWPLPMESPYAQHLRASRELLEPWESPLNRKLAYYCAHYADLLNDQNFLNGVIVVHYEDLVLDAPAALRDLLDQLGLPVDTDRFLVRLDPRRRSTTDFDPKRHEEPRAALTRPWNDLRPEEIQAAQAVFDTFGFRHYRADGPLPARGKVGEYPAGHTG